MALAQAKFREIVFQLLYSMELKGNLDSGVIPLMMETLSVSRSNVCQALEKAVSVQEISKELDEKIFSHSNAYEEGRVSPVDLVILRLALFEMQNTDIPPKVAIAEAIRLSRKFSSPEASKFVNAILDAEFCKTSVA